MLQPFVSELLHELFAFMISRDITSLGFISDRIVDNAWIEPASGSLGASLCNQWTVNDMSVSLSRPAIVVASLILDALVYLLYLWTALLHWMSFGAKVRKTFRSSWPVAINTRTLCVCALAPECATFQCQDLHAIIESSDHAPSYSILKSQVIA